jgi:hypothetical protein
MRATCGSLDSEGAAHGSTPPRNLFSFGRFGEYSMHEYDKSSKWLIEHHGDSILRLAGMRDIIAWKPLPAELVQSRRLPDGVIEVESAGAAEPDVCILEIATYPDARVPSQAVRDAALVHLARDVVPEVVVVFLHPTGNVEASASASIRSRRGLTRWDLSWKAIKIWDIPAAELLATGDVGLVPWVPLAQFDGPPGPIVRQCRARIDRDAPPREHENLLAVTQVLAGLRYNDPRLFEILGGRNAMIESPVLQELKEEWTREAARDTVIKDLVTVLVTRFGAKAEAIEAELTGIEEEARLRELVKHAIKCRSLSAFRKQLGK